MGDVIPFNPLDKINLARSIAVAMEGQDPVSLGSLRRFNGAGVYALYYVGSFPAYDPLALANRVECKYPIYVGKADSKGRRKGGHLESSASGTELFKRLSDHAKSIEQAKNLALDDFKCRYLVVDDLWIALGEALLISQHSPVWNVLVDGFGNHDPGKGRRAGRRPRWDVLHPGRPWAESLEQPEVTAEQIAGDALQYLASRIEVPGAKDEELVYRSIRLGVDRK